MVCATFKIRVFDKNEDASVWLITKKRGLEVTRYDVANAIQRKFERLDIWASDIEDLTQLIDEEVKSEAFRVVENSHKIHI